ncbi:MAG: ribose 5-phosphate isomerase B [Clostridia bacterium]|nr:ribose 5-phosphate isomerase B [Clostridia bacterium]MBQ6708437.1 ribose 5-phosphate isomerase B [Clostridia bacterium]
MLFLGSDHAGYSLKKAITDYFDANSIEYKDLGCDTDSVPCDYPVIAYKVGTSIKEGDLGILCCGSGIGIGIAANKIPGIRAACCSDVFSAKYTRMHNDANILCLGGRTIGPGLAIELVDAFLKAEFIGQHHSDRVEMINKIEKGTFEIK